MSRSSVWTPRGTTRLWHQDAGMILDGKKDGSSRSPPKWKFAPLVNGPYVVPPPPPPLKKPPPKEMATIPAEELISVAAELRRKADSMVQTAPTPGIDIQLGQLLLSKEDFIKKLLKEWDAKGKGELLKAELRLHLRNVGLNATSAEADALFDSWDEDKGGSLDMKELKTALLKTQGKAEAFNSKSASDPSIRQAEAARKQAAFAEQAARITEEADKLKEELEVLTDELNSRADVRLGALLQKRMIKPGAVVTQWAKSRGKHAGELSRADFRNAVLQLFTSKSSNRSPSRRSTGEEERPASPAAGNEPTTSAADIDAVFDSFDEDGGGYMDMDEAKAMIKALHKAADKAEQEKRAKERQFRAARAHATKLANAALKGTEEEDEEEDEEEERPRLW